MARNILKCESHRSRDRHHLWNHRRFCRAEAREAPVRRRPVGFGETAFAHWLDRVWT